MKMALMRAPRPGALWILVLVALALRLVVVALTSGASYDMASYALQAQSVLTHHNVYTFTDRYPYPPVWIWLVALAQWMARTIGFSFDTLVRLPGIVGDVCIVALLQRFKGSKAALFYAVNPVSILITAGHGQFDGLVMALVVAAWALWDARQRRSAAWAALALGGAIALKGYPVLLLPALLVGTASNRQRWMLIGLALAPLFVCVVIYSAFFGLETAMVSHVLGYQSPPLLGWSLYVNSLPTQGWPGPAIFLLSLLLLLLAVGIRTALLFFPVVLVIRKPAWPIAYLWLTTLVGFYVLNPDLSPQYLLWALPLLALIDLKKGLIYSAFSTLALIFVYLWGFPEAIPWGPTLISLLPAYVWLLVYWAANLAWWLACILLLYSLFRQSTSRSSLSGIKGMALDRHENSDSSRPAVASQPKIGEKQGES